MADIFGVTEGARYQTTDETRIYTVTTTDLVSDPTSPTVVVYDEATNADVTSTVMSGGNPTAENDVITFKALSGLTKGHSYRVEFKFTVSDNIFERYFRVRCTI